MEFYLVAADLGHLLAQFGDQIISTFVATVENPDELEALGICYLLFVGFEFHRKRFGIVEKHYHVAWLLIVVSVGPAPLIAAAGVLNDGLLLVRLCLALAGNLIPGQMEIGDNSSFVTFLGVLLALFFLLLKVVRLQDLHIFNVLLVGVLVVDLRILVDGVGEGDIAGEFVAVHEVPGVPHEQVDVVGLGYGVGALGFGELLP